MDLNTIKNSSLPLSCVENAWWWSVSIETCNI